MLPSWQSRATGRSEGGSRKELSDGWRVSNIQSYIRARDIKLYRKITWEMEFNDRLAEYAYPGIVNGIWDAADWIDFYDVLHVYGLNASTTNDELEKIAEDIEEDARKEGVVLVCTWEHLTNCRERLIDREG